MAVKKSGFREGVWMCFVPRKSEREKISSIGRTEYRKKSSSY